ncbi:MAG: hypothetical protein H7Y88_11230 [Phycisphaerales bacterium]|nr:hypothetical protein [Phycisphaerales bacterium]
MPTPSPLWHAVFKDLLKFCHSTIVAPNTQHGYRPLFVLLENPQFDAGASPVIKK